MGKMTNNLTAARFLAALLKNVANYRSDKITEGTFGQRAMRMWAAVKTRGLFEMVNAPYMAAMEPAK